jgi:long-chain acyl-CoA synthetase
MNRCTGSEPPPFTLQYQAYHNPDKTAVVDGNERLSFQELNGRANRFANALSELGIGRGDRVAVLLHNCAEWAEMMFAMAKLKIAPIPIGYRLKGPEIEFIMNNSEAKGLIAGVEFLDVLGKAIPNFKHLESGRTILMGERIPCPFRSYQSLIDGGSDSEPDLDLEENSLTISYTSGTTGRPKGVYRAAQQRDLDALMEIIANFGFTMSDVNLVACPLYHSAPVFFAYIHLIFGATVVLNRRFDPEQFLASVDGERITTAFVVPTQLNRIANLPDAVKRKYDLSSMRALITGAAPCHHSVKAKTIELFGENCLFEFYGSTETGINTILRPEDQLRKIGSCGKALVGNEIRIIGEEGGEVPTGEVGQLFVKNGMLITGYYKDDQATRDSRLGDFFSVGDMGRVDEEGYYYLVDRKKDMVISGGVNIYPAEIEAVLRAHPDVLDCAVIGVPDADWGESLKAVVARRPGRQAPAEALLAFCRERLADYKLPRSFDFVDEIPYNPMGKPLKRELRDRYWKGAGRKI